MSACALSAASLLFPHHKQPTCTPNQAENSEKIKPTSCFVFRNLQKNTALFLPLPTKVAATSIETCLYKALVSQQRDRRRERSSMRKVRVNSKSQESMGATQWSESTKDHIVSF